MQKIRARSLGQEDPLEKEITTHSSILAWRISWQTAVHGVTKKFEHDLATKHTHTHTED